VTATSGEAPTVEAFRPEDFAEGAARLVAACLAEAPEGGGPPLVLLAGGTTPAPVYERLAARARLWCPERFVFALGDERLVGEDQASARNAAMVRRHLLGPLGRDVRFLAVPDGLTPEDAAWRYEAILREALGEDPAPFLAILGLGADGHTASLFPGEALEDAGRLYVATRAPVPPTQRISATRAFLARSAHVVFLVQGTAKREALGRFLAGDRRIPAATVPFLGEVRVFVDLDALP
jgi:6-phosphogluconolactonase